jgi:hypothetical protein
VVAYSTDYSNARDLADRYDIPLVSVNREKVLAGAGSPYAQTLMTLTEFTLMTAFSVRALRSGPLAAHSLAAIAAVSSPPSRLRSAAESR